jgi:hypothetical protein
VIDQLEGWKRVAEKADFEPIVFEGGQRMV